MLSPRLSWLSNSQLHTSLQQFAFLTLNYILVCSNLPENGLHYGSPTHTFPWIGFMNGEAAKQVCQFQDISWQGFSHNSGITSQLPHLLLQVPVP